MYYFGRWTVLEEPALGTATLTLWMNIDGNPIGPPYSDSSTVYSAIDPRSITFKIKGNPWHRTGLRPFACDVVPGPKRGAGPDPKYPEVYEVIIIAVASDVELDRSDYNMQVGQRITPAGRLFPSLPLQVVSVADPSLLPDLGEPIYLPELLPTECFYVLDAIVDDWMDSDDTKKSLTNQQPLQIVSPDDSVAQSIFPEGFMPTYISLRESLGESIFDKIWISRREDGLDIFCAEKPSSSPTKFRFSVKWDATKPIVALWQLTSPLLHKNAQAIPQTLLRCIISPQLEDDVQYETYHEGSLEDRDGNAINELVQPDLALDYDSVRVELCIVETSDRHPERAFNESDRFRPRYPERRFRQVSDQLHHTYGTALRRDPFALIGLSFFFIVPFAPAIAITVGMGLSIGSVYCALAERAQVARFGYDSTKQHRSRSEVDRDLNMAIAGLILNFSGPLVKGGSMLVNLLKRLPSLVRSLSRASTPIRLLLRAAEQKSIENVAAEANKLLEPDEIITPGKGGAPDSVLPYKKTGLVPISAPGKVTSLRQVFSLVKTFTQEILKPASNLKMLKAPSPQQFITNEMAINLIMQQSGKAFKSTILEKMYLSYATKIQSNFEAIESGIDLIRAKGRLPIDRLSWLIRGADSVRKATIVRALLGPEWRRILHEVRDFMPLQDDVLEIYNKFPKGSLTYQEAQMLRNQIVPNNLKKITFYTETLFHPQYRKLVNLVTAANKKSFGAMFELEHPFELRCVKALAHPDLDPEGKGILDYVMEAKVILVAKNRRVAQHIPNYSSYIHFEKSRLMETLIAYGKEDTYSLQEMRDAHVFAISLLDGPDSPAIKMVDEAVAIIAKNNQMTIKFPSPTDSDFRKQFREKSWRYFKPSEENQVAMSEEQYLRQRFLIDEELTKDLPLQLEKALEKETVPISNEPALVVPDED